MQVCCIKDPKFKTNVTVDEEFLPRQSGDLTIMYDVTGTYESNYWAQVIISNHNPLGRPDNWKLSFDWRRDEFIYTMRGAYPYVVDSSDCIFCPQGTHYRDLDFGNVFNCERRPTIIDLPPAKANDTTLGLIPKCCRNGTNLPPTMDPSKSSSVFQTQVFKMPPDLNRAELSPSQNWKINGTLNPDCKCGPTPKVASRKCRVSFSSYYNDSVVPCRTCACGCPSNTARTCSTNAPSVFLPPKALLIPFENRTAITKAWADLKHRTVPNPMPCGGNCGVSINWHVYTDYSRGWSARITIFNWDETAFPDWFAAVQMDKATPGFQKMYNFTGTALELNGVNNTIFVQGLPGLNYLMAEIDGANPQKDPRVPGKQ
ncbi:hypothetical protein CRYUN_Cryun36dG0098900 [Craigia yunnanensis]